MNEPSTIRALFVAPMIRELGGGNVTVDSYLRRYGLSLAQLSSLYECVPLKQFVALAEDAARRLERPFLGLELGANFKLADLGPFYAMFILARDLQGALSCLGRFQSTWQTNTVLELLRGHTTSACRYLIQDPSIWPRRQDAEFAIASFTTFIRELTGQRWSPLGVELEHDVQDRIGPLKEFFKAPVQGNCSANQLIIANSDLDKPLRGRFEAGAQDVASILERHLMELLGSAETRQTQSTLSRVDALIARRMGREEVTIEVIAAEMSMSVRSLRRHLTQEGTSFRQMLQVHRRTAIEAVLSSEGGRLSDLANRVSYSDSAVLSRAFKTWTGMSPRAYSKSQKR